jgi:tripartite-type tricarboxylate transporter receptor subunit TctC
MPSSPTPARRRFLIASAAAGLSPTVWPFGAFAKENAFPVKALRLVIPFTAGGGTDLVGRLLADGMGRTLKQTVIVDNKPGAGSMIGTDYVAKSPPDGYNLVVVTTAHAINPSLMRKMPFTTVESFAPVAMIGRAPNVLIVRPDSPFKTTQDMLAFARANPGKLTYGSSGNGTAVHLAAELLQTVAGIKLTHVPYRGAGQAQVDLVGGQLDMVFATIPSAAGAMETGRVRALGVTSAKRSPIWPAIPTIAETGAPGYAAEVWYAVLAKAGTPANVVATLNAAVRTAATSDAFKKQVEAEGLEVAVSTPDALRAYLLEEEMRWRKVVQAAGIEPT